MSPDPPLVPLRLVPAWMATVVINGQRSSGEFVFVRDETGVLRRMHRMTPVLRRIPL